MIKKMQIASIIGFLIEALISSNLFIFIYNNLLRLLNLFFPASPSPGFIREGAVPEPFEIPLYLVLSVLIVILLFLIHKAIAKQNSSSSRSIVIKSIIFLALLGVFIKNIGDFPLARDIYPYKRQPGEIYTIYLSIYLGFMALVGAYSVIFNHLVTSGKKIYKVIFFIFIALVIALLTFEPRFPLVGHDYSYFFGPIWEIVHGKTIYTDVSSQYGFLSVLLFSLLFKFKFFSFPSFPAFIWSLYIIEYFLCFYLIYKISRSTITSTLGILSIITINYFSLYHLPASIAQSGPLRWLALVASLALFYKYKRFDSKRFIFLISLLSFWTLDIGISLIMSYLFTLFILKLTNSIDFKRLIKACSSFMLSLILIFLSINLIHFLLGYKLINFLLVFKKLGQYSQSGFGMIPIDSYSHFWIVILIYFSSIIYFFRTSPNPLLNKEGNLRGGELQTLLFSANLALFSSAYFVGRSHDNNLFHISVLPLLTLFLLLGFILKNGFSNKSRLSFLIFNVTFFIFLVAYPCFQRQEVLAELIREKIKRVAAGNIFKPELMGILNKKYPMEASLINQNLTEKQILILSPDDTYLYFLTGKENLMMDNSQVTILTEKDLSFSLQKVFKKCPKKIVADCGLMNKCKKSDPFTVDFFSIQPLLLQRIQTACKLKYEPVVCTNQICIAEAK